MNSNTLWLIGRRLGAGVVTLLIVSMVVFAITAVLPGMRRNNPSASSRPLNRWRHCA